MEIKRIKEWPEDERPREMLLKKGPEALSDAMLLAILLRTGRQGKNAIDLAREMLDKLGGFPGLLSARDEDLMHITGIGKAKLTQILAVVEIVRRQFRQPLKKTNVIDNPDALFNYLKTSMQNLPREEFRVLHLNRAKHLMSEETLFRGTVDESIIYAREVVESALRQKASALIFVHNHPNGTASESPEDMTLTTALVSACRAVLIPVLDHVIIGLDGYLSMRRSYPELFA